jgi:hypothetical protein
MTSAENPRAGQGPVLLDVGGSVGALVVRMPSSMEGVEIEIRPQQPGQQHLPQPTTQTPQGLTPSPHSHLTHVEVLPRPTPSGFVSCAVFPELTEGRYELYERRCGPVRLWVAITGGEVTQASWPPGEQADRPDGGSRNQAGNAWGNASGN